MQDTASSTPWDSYRRTLIALLCDRGQLESGDGLQVANDFQPALWDDPTYGDWLVREQVAQIIPLWGDFYLRSSGNRVTDALLQFLTNVDLHALDPPHATSRAARNVAPTTHEALCRAMAVQHRHHDALMTWKRPMTGAAGTPDAPHARPSTLMAEAETHRTTVWSLSQRLLQEISPTQTSRLLLAKALLNFNNPAYQAPLTDDNGVRLSYRVWNVQPSLKSFLALAREGKADKVEIDVIGPRFTASTAGAGPASETLISTGFLRLGSASSAVRPLAAAAGSGSPSFYRIAFQAAGMAAIDLAPGAWYDAEAICRFRSGPFIATGPFGSGAATLWGEGGVFPYTPARVFVAYQPSITATLDSAAFQSVRASWTSGRTIGLGPFEFSPTGVVGGRADTARFDTATREISLHSRSLHPVIIAMSNRVMPCGS